MKSIFGLPQNIVAMFAYFSPFTAILMYIFERENKFVRFHALQGTIILVTLSILIRVIVIVPLLGAIVASLLSVIMSIVMLYMMISTVLGKEVKIPILGDIVWDQVNK